MDQFELLENILAELDASNIYDSFVVYHNLLLEWNQKMNLISKEDEKKVISRHFLESIGLLTIESFPEGSRVLDLGSGAGFPGLPLKLVRPDIYMILVESRRKKCLFLNQVVETLNLPGVRVIQSRAEKLQNAFEPVDYVISRAVSDLLTLVRWSRTLLSFCLGKLIVIKGPHIQHELEVLKAESENLKIESVNVYPYHPFSQFENSRNSLVVIVKMRT